MSAGIIRKAFISIAVLVATLATIVIIVFIIYITDLRREVPAETKSACLHYGNQEIMQRVIKSWVKNPQEVISFQAALDAATHARMLIDTNNISLSGDVWMVPFTQYQISTGTLNYLALLDCAHLSVEFSGGYKSY